MSAQNEPIDLQKLLFEAVLSKHHSKAEATTALMELLDMGKSSLYRKMTNKSALKPNEIETLASHYNISLDELILNQTDAYLFDYIDGLKDFNNIGLAYPNNNRSQDLNTATNLCLSYSGSEIPLFYLCHYPELIYFKIHVWKRLKNDQAIMDYAIIDFSVITPEEKTYYNEMTQFYNQKKSVELWDNKCISLIVEQISYSYYVGILLLEDAQLLLTQVHRLLNRLERMLELGSKQLDRSQPNLQVYYNPIPSANWFYIVESDEFSYTQAIMGSPNTVICQHLKFVEAVKTRFNALKRQSQLISEAGTIQRKKIFKLYRKQVNKLVQELDFEIEL